jgi:hypothetical protein
MGLAGSKCFGELVSMTVIGFIHLFYSDSVGMGRGAALGVGDERGSSGGA